MQLLWTDLALLDRQKIREYIAQDSIKSAIEIDDLFSQKTQLIAEQPYLGKVGRVPNTREFVMHPSYILVYDLTDKAIRILRILNSAQNWP